MPTKRRRLSDLYVTGKEVHVTDGALDPRTGEPVEPIVVWVQKLNPVENEDALRRASAVRARELMCAKDKESEEWMRAAMDVEDFSNREMLLSMAIREELDNRRIRIEAEQAAEDEWSEDNYLQGLVDSWEGSPEVPGLKETYATDPEDPEAKRVFAELDKFNSTVEKLVEAEREALLRDYESIPDEQLIDKAVKTVLEQRATTAFINEYELWQLYFSTRTAEKHADLYFTGIDEVKATAQEVREKLLEAYRLLAVEPSEGKGSEETPVSSPLSEQPEPEATGESSGPQVASQ